MQLSYLAIQIIILLIPGAVYRKIYLTLRPNKSKKDWEDYFELIFISLGCYFILRLLQSIVIEITPQVAIYFIPGYIDNIIDIFTTDKPIANIIEIFQASFIGIVIAFVMSYIKQNHYINRLGQNLKVTNRHGDEDLWDVFHSGGGARYVTVHDLKSNLFYLGYALIVSETEKDRELILRAVTIYNSTRTVNYEVDELYLSRAKDDISIEYRDYEAAHYNELVSNTVSERDAIKQFEQQNSDDKIAVIIDTEKEATYEGKLKSIHCNENYIDIIFGDATLHYKGETVHTSELSFRKRSDCCELIYFYISNG